MSRSDDKSKPGKPGRKPKYRPEQVAEAIRQSNGLLTVAAKRLGLSLSRVSRYTTRTKVCARAAESAIEGVKDLAEAKLYNAINNGESWAICFFLKCRAKDRGYIERVEHAGELRGGETNVTVNLDAHEIDRRFDRRLELYQQRKADSASGNGSH
jgi:Tfp pilus assembly protein PilX